MEKIFAPWRMKYITADPSEKDPAEIGCIFCNFPKLDEDEKRLIVTRGKKAFVIMNAYPYTNGHLMVVPYRHTCDFTSLTAEEAAEITLLAQKAVKVIKTVMKPHGFNIGINIGRTAGAGIDQHLHIHIVPRWDGDTNFMPVLDDVRIVSESLEDSYRRIKEEWDKTE